MERLIRACRDVDCIELWCFTGVLDDRFNPAVPWTVQLDATAQFLASLAPLLRDLGCRLNLETHEEITTFELARLVETVGPDVLGVCLDTANLLVEAENPTAALRRVAPYVHQTHVMDAIVYFASDGLERQARPCGEDVLDWDAIITILAGRHPDLTLSIENRNGHYPVPIYDPAWQAVHPDLTTAEMIEVVRLARITEEKIRRGEWEDAREYERVPWVDRQPEALQTSVRFLRGILSARAARPCTAGLGADEATSSWLGPLEILLSMGQCNGGPRATDRPVSQPDSPGFVVPSRVVHGPAATP